MNYCLFCGWESCLSSFPSMINFASNGDLKVSRSDEKDKKLYKDKDIKYIF